MREAIGREVVNYYPLSLPNGKFLKIKVRQCGIAELMEAQNGERQQTIRQKTTDFNSRNWRRNALKKINFAIIDWQFVDDMDSKRPKLESRELPFSLLRGDEFNILMELAYPGFLAESGDIQDKADDIRSGSMQDVPSSGSPL